MKRSGFVVLLFTFITFILITKISVFADSENENNFTYSVAEDGRAVITGYTGKLKGVVVPDTIDGYKVHAIGDKAFEGDENLVSVKLPEGLVSIGEYAFADCYNLETVDIPEGVEKIGSYAFKHAGFTEIYIPGSISEIEDYVFYGCSVLKEIDLTEGVTKVGNYAFASCSFLEKIQLPNTLYSIGEYAFSECLSLKSISIPKSVTSIGKRAFYLCSDLYAINAHKDNPVYFTNEGVLYELTEKDEIRLLFYPSGKYSNNYYVYKGTTEIASEAFAESKNIVSINIPSTVKKIGDHAFLSCSNLKDIYV